MKLPTMAGAGGLSQKFQFYPASNRDASREVFGAFWMAQLFTVTTGHTLTHLFLPLYRVLSPGTVTVSIQGVSGGDPDGTDISVGSFDGDTILGVAPSAIIELHIPSVLLTAQQYAIVIRNGAGAGNLVAWDEDASSPTYGGGSRSDSSDSGASWTPQTGNDFIFEEWGTPT